MDTDNIDKTYRIFISSTQCLMAHYREVIIRAILEKGHLPIAQEYAFKDGSYVAPKEKIIEKLSRADAVILAISPFQGSLVNEQCDECILNNCSHKKANSRCVISYTQFEYYLANQLGIDVWVLLYNGETEKQFISVKNACKKYCYELNSQGISERNCIQKCKRSVSRKNNGMAFFEWVEELKSGSIIAQFNDIKKLESTAKSIINSIENRLSNNESKGLISIPDLGENAPLIYKNQSVACKNLAEEIEHYSAIRYLAIRASSVVDKESSDGYGFLLNNKSLEITLCISSPNNNKLIEDRAIANGQKTEEYRSTISFFAKKIEQETQDWQNFHLFYHSAYLPFRLIFFDKPIDDSVPQNLLFISFLSNQNARESPVYRYVNTTEMYEAFNKYYEDVINHAEKRI